MLPTDGGQYHKNDTGDGSSKGRVTSPFISKIRRRAAKTRLLGALPLLQYHHQNGLPERTACIFFNRVSSLGKVGLLPRG